MTDDVNSDLLRARDFDVVRRGYDRAQVDAHLNDLRERLRELADAVDEAKSQSLAVGIDDREALANELSRIGDEVAQILEAARAAAEGLRTRAAADAEKWRTEAEAETTAAIASAKEQTQALRSSAWNEGTALLNSAAAEAKKIAAAAQDDALFMRAEAERDALRLTSDARRDKEEALRSARQEAEVILAEARSESDGVLAAAQKQADLAQERARALEDRRSELLAELEATRASISHLEDEIDSRRQELEAPPEPEPEEVDDSHHGLDVGSVRIVSPSKAMTLRPVDPDELVAEVTAMRASTATAAAPPEPEQPRVEPDTVAVISPPGEVPVPSGHSQPAEPPPDPEPAHVPEPEHDEADTPVVPAQPTSSEPAPAPVTDEIAEHSVASDSTSGDEIGSLFAALRSSDEARDDGPVPGPTESVDASDAAGSEPIESNEAPEPLPVPVVEPPVEPEAPVPAQAEAPSDDDVDQANELAIRNAALKDIKRGLVELQNETLEALRTDETWTPDDGFMDRFDDPFARVAEVSETGSPSDAADAFASDLHDSVLSALEESRTSGKGSRAVAAAASKVFRTWRSDEAERRLQRL